MRLRRSPPAGAAAEFASVPRPADGTPWRSAGWCAIDLEMTGLDPRSDEIIAVGAVPIDGGRIVLGGGMYTLVNSELRSNLRAVVVHKLRVPDLAGAPPLNEAMDRMLELLSGRVPVFHTAAIETAFLTRQFGRRRVRLPEAADTEVLGRMWLRQRDGSAPEGISLTGLANALGQPAETPHHALGDALTTAKAFIALASLLDTVAPQTVGSLVGASRPTSVARRFGAG
ncbi:MAG TPA: 3'-5' exonuclease [Solirubrobacteraceae bacterium]|nr:3'-5' exonuclease [Solirubrobacteraceae bacterium]